MKSAQDLLVILQRHIGAGAGVSVYGLAAELNCTTRAVRHLVTELRATGHAVCGHPKTGYYLAASACELEATCSFLRARALHSLTLEAALRKLTLPDLLGQLKLNT